MSYSGITSFKDSVEFLHSSVHLGNIEEVKQFLTRNPGRNTFYNDSNESAASVALKYERLEIYELLIANNVTLGPKEDVKAIVAGTSCDFKISIRDINRKYSKDSKPKHLVSFYAKSKFSYNSDKHHAKRYFNAIVSAFDTLNTFKIIEPILKVCAFYEMLNIFFDFNNESIEFMDPTKTKSTSGTAYIHSGFIYIGAKGLLVKEKRNAVLGTLIHEMCHFALTMMYRNQSKPYYASDLGRRKKFHKVAHQCKQYASVEPIVQSVFKYLLSLQHAELIVRVPHLTAFYLDNSEKYFELTETFSDLFEFFEQHTLVDLNSEYQKLQEMQEIKRENKSFGIIASIEIRQIFFRTEYVLSSNIGFKPAEKINKITSNCPRLTMVYFYQLFKSTDNFDGLNVFTSMELLKCAETLDKLVKLWRLSVEPTIFIECEDSETDFEPLEKLLNQVKNRRIVVIANDKVNLSIEACKYDVEHVWSQLDTKAQKSLILKKIKFQGNKVALKDLLIADLYELIPLKSLLSDNGIIVGKQVEILNNEIYIDRKYSFNSEQLNCSEMKTLNEIADLNKDNQCILISNEPGMGKTTELRMMTIKLKEKLPLNWVIFINLKEFAKSYQTIGNVEDFDSANKVVNYLCDKILCLKGFEAELFAYLFDCNRIVFLTDGFDEVSPTFNDFVINLLKAIVDRSKNQLWISTRPHLEQELVAVLNPQLLRIEPFTAQNQQEYFEKFCSLKALDNKSVNSYLEAINHTKNATSNPLITRIIAEIFQEGFDHDIRDFDSYSIYELFVNKLIARTYEKGSEYQKELTKHLQCPQSLIDVHCKFAIKTVLGEEEVTKEAIELMIQNCSNFSKEEIARLGILYFDSSSHHFVHKSFAEYFIASFFIRHLFLKNSNSLENNLKSILLCYVNVIQSGKDSQKILNFVENGLAFHKMTNEFFNDQAKSEFINFLHQHENKNFLHHLIKCGCKNLVEITLSSMGESFPKNFFLAKENSENILMTLAKETSFESLEKFLQFLKSNLNSDEIESLLLEQNNTGQNAHKLSLENSNEAVRDFLESISVLINDENNDVEQNFEACFQERIDHAKAEALNQEGNKLFNAQKYAEAIEKYDVAISLCPSRRTDSMLLYKYNKADCFDKIGKELFDNQDYEGASPMFNAACDASPYEMKDTFVENIRVRTYLPIE